MATRRDSSTGGTHPANAITTRVAALHSRRLGGGDTSDSRRLWPVAMLAAATALWLATWPVHAAQETGHQHGAHHDNTGDGDTGRVPAPEGMTIEILEPGAEAVFAPGATVPVQVRAEGMSVSGDHWHLYLDGELQAMVGAGRMAYELVLPETLEAGEHELKVTISNARHQEYDLAATRTIRVEASDRSPSDSPAE